MNVAVGAVDPDTVVFDAALVAGAEVEPLAVDAVVDPLDVDAVVEPLDADGAPVVPTVVAVAVALVALDPQLDTIGTINTDAISMPRIVLPMCNPLVLDLVIASPWLMAICSPNEQMHAEFVPHFRRHYQPADW